MARHTGLPVTEPSVASRNRAVDSERQPIEASEVAQWAAFYESDREAAVADWDELYREGRPTDPAGMGATPDRRGDEPVGARAAEHQLVATPPVASLWAISWPRTGSTSGNSRAQGPTNG
jgi:hypothetical protein